MSNYTSSENKRLLKALKKSDEQIFEYIFNSMYEKIFAFMLTYTKDHISAEDIVQQSFIKLWEKRKELPSDTIISAFLFTISRNLFIDIYRKERRKISISDEIHLEAVLDREAESSETLNVRREKLIIAVENLPTKCKEVFELRQKDNLKNKEIALFLGISEKTVEDHMSRALRLLREQLLIAFMLFVMN